jgi:hypothetical protein
MAVMKILLCGIDAMFAKLNIYIQDSAKVIHKSHNRSDGLFDHIKGKHLIMNRYRNLINKYMSK